MTFWNILQTFGIFYDHLVHFVFIWYNFSGFGTMHQENLATLVSTSCCRFYHPGNLPLRSISTQMPYYPLLTSLSYIGWQELKITIFQEQQTPVKEFAPSKHYLR
jgi:hypothetical protein